jgi:hypothetical protein
LPIDAIDLNSVAIVAKSKLQHGDRRSTSKKKQDLCEVELRMTDRDTTLTEELSENLDEIESKAQAIAAQCEGNAPALLALLRTLESLHREICTHQFQDALPNNRQALYAFLKDMESQGGWPYIPRLRLRSFLEQFIETKEEE